MSFSELKTTAKEKLRGKWGIAIIAMILVGLVGQGPSLLGQFFTNQGTQVGSILSLASIALLPITIGYARLHMDLAADLNPDVDRIFYGFQNGRYANNILTVFLMGLFIFLWSLLLIIPGIIKSFAYAMTTFILADPDFDHLTPTEAITKSREMMDGHKGDLFILMLTFIGWAILVVLTAGILAFYVSPYIQQTTTQFYYKVKGVSPVSSDNLEPVEEDTSKSEDPFYY